MPRLVSSGVVMSVCIAGAALGVQSEFTSPRSEDGNGHTQSSQVLSVTLADGRGGRYTRSFQAPNGIVYMLGSMKVIEGGRRWALCDESDPPWPAGALHEKRMNSFLSKQGLFIALENKVLCKQGACTARMWRSVDDLKTIHEERTSVIIPEAGKVDTPPDKWPPLIFHRGILELEDGSFLAAMYGQFEQDTTIVSERSEGAGDRKSRAFVVRSADRGKSWRFLANVAVPDPKGIDDSEGFNEWHFIRLADARLFGVVRTGHYTPMVAVWSGDNGRTWTKPKTLPGLGPAGVDPYLLRLSDGRLALAFGDIVQPTEPKEDWWKRYEDKTVRRPWNGDPRSCNLAINRDGTGASWETSIIGDFGKRTGYATVFEIEPNVLVYQCDLDVWRIDLRPVPANAATRAASPGVPD